MYFFLNWILREGCTGNFALSFLVLDLPDLPLSQSSGTARDEMRCYYTINLRPDSSWCDSTNVIWLTPGKDLVPGVLYLLGGWLTRQVGVWLNERATYCSRFLRIRETGVVLSLLTKSSCWVQVGDLSGQWERKCVRCYWGRWGGQRRERKSKCGRGWGRNSKRVKPDNLRISKRFEAYDGNHFS